ncbi:protein kinase domain-containing protein [Streptomyces litmocidini]|uniref:protein kinase domain-containing protein n=1 Tax=Streptomyces litmocidini TaxID=67318 RepID=UPI0036F7B3C4
MSNTSHHIGPDSAPDRYRLLRSIGRGGEAVLYLAEIELAGGTEPVVVKVLDSKTTITPEVFERVSQKWNEQAELLRFVHRPGVVGVREHFQGPPIHRPGESGTLTGRALVLVMNHVDGLDLRDWRAERTLGTPGERREVMRTLEQLADVLDWLHSGKATPSGRTVVHGDLSPGNVMVDEHGQATLVDFGLSKLTADHHTVEVWFTPGYAAPEVFEGRRTPATDRYAFGAIAYFLLSGESPPAAPEQLVAAFRSLPQIGGLPEEQRQRVLSIAAADADRRPISLSSWVKDVRHGVVSTTTSRPATVEDAAPPAPVTPPSAAPPVAPPQPTTPPVAAPPVVAPQPSTEPPTVATPAPAPAPAPGFGAPGYGPPTPASTVPPARGPRRRRKGPLIGAVAGVVLIAVLALIGVRLLGDKGDKGGDEAKGGTPAATTATSAPATPDPTDSPSETPTEEPTTQEPTTEESGTATPTATAGDAPESASLTTYPSVRMDAFEAGTAALGGTYIPDALRAVSYCSGRAEFNLGKRWSKLDLIVGIDDEAEDYNSRVDIWVDGKALFGQTVTLGEAKKLSLDVRNGLRLVITFGIDSCSEPGLVIGNPVLKK